jgi:hypothetical protein
MERKLTGRTKYRSTWRGKLILQVEEEWSDDCLYSGPRNSGKLWRDARTEDLAELQWLEAERTLDKEFS